MDTNDNLFDSLSYDFEQFYDEASQISSDADEIISPSFVSLSELNDKYEQQELLGKGGMKKVIKVYDNFARRGVAMALLHNDADKDLYDPFIHEAWLTSQLDHPNIIKIHDVGINEKKQPFFTMDLKTGVSLRDFLADKNSSHSLDQLLEVFLKICDAIAYAHSKHILHLDLKPENIQIGSFGEVMVCDWGLGKLITLDDGNEIDKLLLNSELRDDNLRFAKFSKGTPGFMAPEQKSGEDLSFLTDVFGLGALLKSMLSVDKEFNNKSLNAVVQKAMSESPALRYQSVENLREEVKKFRLGYSTNAEQAGISEELKLFYHRNKPVCISATLSLIVIILGTALFVIKLDQSRRFADENFRLAEKEREKAEYSLNLYHQEKASLANLMDNYSKDIYSDNTQLVSREFYQAPLKVANDSLQRLSIILRHNPNDKKALSQKKYILFCLQRYAEADEISNYKKDPLLNFISKIIKDLDLTNHKTVSYDLLFQIIDKFDTRTQRVPFLSKLITCDYTIRKRKDSRKKEPNGYHEVVKKVLQYYNPKWKTGKFIYNPDKKTLQLSGKNLKHLNSLWKGDLSLLRFIPIKNLHINDSDFFSLYELEGLSLNKLNLCGTQVTDLRPLELFPKLKSLVITKNQFSQKQLSVLPKRVTVTEK